MGGRDHYFSPVNNISEYEKYKFFLKKLCTLYATPTNSYKQVSANTNSAACITLFSLYWLKYYANSGQFSDDIRIPCSC